MKPFGNSILNIEPLGVTLLVVKVICKLAVYACVALVDNTVATLLFGTMGLPPTILKPLKIADVGGIVVAPDVYVKSNPV